jgi:hypothetical protein
MDREQELQERAYRIWEEEGRLDGNDREHWLRAEQQHEQAEREVEEQTGSGTGPDKGSNREAAEVLTDGLPSLNPD